MNKAATPDNLDNQSIEEDKEDWDDKKPMIAKEASKENSLMATIIGKSYYCTLGHVLVTNTK